MHLTGGGRTCDIILERRGSTAGGGGAFKQSKKKNIKNWGVFE